MWVCVGTGGVFFLVCFGVYTPNMITITHTQPQPNTHPPTPNHRLVEQVESHHDCDLPTCPCHKLLRRRAQANDELAAEADLAPATGALYRLGSSSTRQAEHNGGVGSGSGSGSMMSGGGMTGSSGGKHAALEDKGHAQGGGVVGAPLAPAMGGLYRSGSSHAAGGGGPSPGPSLRAGTMYRAGSSTSTVNHALSPVNTVVTPGGALYRSGSRAPPAVAVRSMAHAAQEIGLASGVGGVVGEDGGSVVQRTSIDEEGMMDRDDDRDDDGDDDDRDHDNGGDHERVVEENSSVSTTHGGASLVQNNLPPAIDPTSPFSQQQQPQPQPGGGSGAHPPLPRVVVDGARQASLPTGASMWLRKANQAEEELAQRLLESLHPSDSEVWVGVRVYLHSGVCVCMVGYVFVWWGMCVCL